MTVRATYRLQFHAGFTFADAISIIPYLADIGISHVYASPITRARKGSTHGYDVVDPTVINPELGGAAGFEAFASAARAKGIGIIIDIVPNHMGVAGGENAWWNDVLRLGQDSGYARFFDIDWSGPLVLPILGATLEEVIAAGDLRVEREEEVSVLRLYGEQSLPLRPGSDSGASLRDLAEAQHYRLVHWRMANDCLNWRRFFSINDLAGLRMEDPHVYAATHKLYFDLFREGWIDGVRIDHVDGLTDPTGYCRQLRSDMDAIRGGADRAYIVVEKILAADEALSADWGVDGTTGYDAMRDLTALMHDGDGLAKLDALWREVAPDAPTLDAAALLARQDMLGWQFDGQLSACVASAMAAIRSACQEEAALGAITPAMMRRAMERLLWVFPVYRTYGTGGHAPDADGAIRERVWRDVQRRLPPGEGAVARIMLDWLAGDGPGVRELIADVARRFQQLSAPIAAKAVEDTLFYRHAPLLSANDVGSAPEQPAIDAATFHRRVLERQRHFPQAMIATATHDHKRGEDARARIAVLTEIPEYWAERWVAWDGMIDALGSTVHRADRYQIMQGLVGAWPDPDTPDLGDLADRMDQWVVKMLREGRLRSSWEQPDEAYEMACTAMLRGLLNMPVFLTDFAGFIAAIAPAARANMLVQTVLKYMMPGVPDLYQGTEFPDFSLVDPDNRRPVDFRARIATLAGENDRFTGAKKLHLIARLLDMRRRHPALFAEGTYQPVAISGPRADHAMAFLRVHGDVRLLCAVQLQVAPPLIAGGSMVPDREWWGGSVAMAGSPVALADLFETDPVHVGEM
ncbi:malto-oligosyltrehalose synthase [Sphingobium sp.]|uniref:malto-oligosyltrehalose synthase n=1 Tax=Sphingobium sp. TaxID=1912891 RepID=UPI003BB7E941